MRALRRQVARMDWLVESLLKLAKLDAGTARFCPETIPLSALLARAADQGWWVAGAHLPFPCIGHVRREGRAGYAWVPAEFGPARVAP